MAVPRSSRVPPGRRPAPDDRGGELVPTVLDQVEAEREACARLLHDEPLQTLCVSLLRMQVLQRALPDDAAADLGRIIESTRGAIGQLQDLQSEIFPTALEVLDLDALVLDDIARVFPDRAEPVVGRWEPGEPGRRARLTLLRLLRLVLRAAAEAGEPPRRIDAAHLRRTDGIPVTVLFLGFEPPASFEADVDWDVLDRRARLRGGEVGVDRTADAVRVRLAAGD